jgi:hypothetical protein
MSSDIPRVPFETVSVTSEGFSDASDRAPPRKELRHCLCLMRLIESDTGCIVLCRFQCLPSA